MRDDLVIVGMARTPLGDFMGELSALSTVQLGEAVIRAAVERAGLEPAAVETVTMGCVLPAGLGQAPARQAALAAGLAEASQCQTINKMCGSGLQALILACDALSAQSCEIAVAGGMESMSRAPYLLTAGRGGYRMGHQRIYDHMMLDGLEDVYQSGTPMGVFAEQTARHYGFSRESQDAFALESLSRAQRAAAEGRFDAEIVSLTVPAGRNGVQRVDSDEHPRSVKAEKIPQLKPAFVENGTVTAANSSAISDGAAALVVMSLAVAEHLGLTPLARVVGHAAHSQAPQWFTTAPVGAIRRLLQRISWDVGKVDLFEVNEAFAAVTLAAMQELAIPREKMNVHGGACALGHPIGASGARIAVTLLAALQTYGLKRGIASLCIGGGEAVAVAFERFC